ncbi:hypothetical protein [Candidatus Mycobacterium methanotrophicum]|uniref:Uncharacterized protein n=1 Tax=Candidatus Mycobacterium methanotrophicum TaxID=2943498 RepID=A0ABY4QSS0_9MYCO|nr:hypothetical protein [Candidatus Mycobacterium methanotrophicum]UQX13388.1 hypothetical protein M5I08_10295 [Candidatus Mycobacterium methanotrophicum]
MTSPAALQLCRVGEVSAHGVAAAPAVGDAGTFFVFGFVTPVARWCFPARPGGRGAGVCPTSMATWTGQVAPRLLVTVATTPLGTEPTSRCGEVSAVSGFGFVVGVERVDQADAMRAHGADAVVSDLAEILDMP